jgi:hypothetical protein
MKLSTTFIFGSLGASPLRGDFSLAGDDVGDERKGCGSCSAFFELAFPLSRDGRITDAEAVDAVLFGSEARKANSSVLRRVIVSGTLVSSGWRVSTIGAEIVGSSAWMLAVALRV